jgi:hypothetical protein
MRLSGLLLLPLAAASVALAQTEPRLAYPATQRGDVVETQFGVAVADPYRCSRMTCGRTMTCAPG